MTGLFERLARGDVVILDGPTSTQLERKGLSNANGAWSAMGNLDHTDVVQQVHEEYIDAGADIITTNTFATSRLTVETVGRDAQAREINQRACMLLCEPETWRQMAGMWPSQARYPTFQAGIETPRAIF